MGMSFWHLLIILIIVLMFFGPSRLEGMGSSLGKAIRGFKKGIEGEGEESEKKSKTIDATANKTESDPDKKS